MWNGKFYFLLLDRLRPIVPIVTTFESEKIQKASRPNFNRLNIYGIDEAKVRNGQIFVQEGNPIKNQHFAVSPIPASDGDQDGGAVHLPTEEKLYIEEGRKRRRPKPRFDLSHLSVDEVEQLVRFWIKKWIYSEHSLFLFSQKTFLSYILYINIFSRNLFIENCLMPNKTRPNPWEGP